MKRDDLFDLNEAVQHPGVQLAVDITTELPQEGDLDLRAPLEGYLEAISTGNLLLLTGEFKGVAALECARCTGTIEVEFQVEINEQFPIEGVPAAYSAKESARIVPEEDYPLFEGNSLMVDALLREAVLVALPMQPLCASGWDKPCPIAEKLGVSLPPDDTVTLTSELGKLMHEKPKEQKKPSSAKATPRRNPPR